MSLTSCFHGVYHLRVVFMACVAFRLAAFLALDAFRLAFITCFALIFYFRCESSSLLGFLSLYSDYPFQAGFMVFSTPNLVLVACVAFSLVFGIFCSYLFSMSFPLFRTVFSWCVALLSSCAARHFGLVVTFSILCGPCFFCMHAPSHIL